MFPFVPDAAHPLQQMDDCSQQQAVDRALAASENIVTSCASLDEFAAAPLADPPRRFECDGVLGELGATSVQVTQIQMSQYLMISYQVPQP